MYMALCAADYVNVVLSIGVKKYSCYKVALLWNAFLAYGANAFNARFAFGVAMWAANYMAKLVALVIRSVDFRNDGFALVKHT